MASEAVVTSCGSRMVERVRKTRRQSTCNEVRQDGDMTPLCRPESWDLRSVLQRLTAI